MYVNRERLWNHVSVLCEEIGPRLSGTPADERTVEYISGHFRRCGTQVEMQNYPCPGWSHEATGLTLHSTSGIARRPLRGLKDAVRGDQTGRRAALTDSHHGLDDRGACLVARRRRRQRGPGPLGRQWWAEPLPAAGRCRRGVGDRWRRAQGRRALRGTSWTPSPSNRRDRARSSCRAPSVVGHWM